MLPQLFKLCHPSLSFYSFTLDPVCRCILTASLFSALFFIHDCHSKHYCHSMDVFPIPNAPHLIAVALFTLYHVDSCLMLLFSCLLFNSHMPLASFMLLTSVMSVIPPILFTCFMLLTHLPTFQSFSLYFFMLVTFNFIDMSCHPLMYTSYSSFTCSLNLVLHQ